MFGNLRVSDGEQLAMAIKSAIYLGVSDGEELAVAIKSNILQGTRKIWVKPYFLQCYTARE
jgi:hypothetical protein